MTTSQNRRTKDPQVEGDENTLADGPVKPAGRARDTREVGVRELKHRTSEVIDRVTGGERVAVTRRGRIVAVILSVDESLEFVLAYAEEFALARAAALDSTKAGE